MLSRLLALALAGFLAATAPMSVAGASVPAESALRTSLSGNCKADAALWDMARWRADLDSVYAQRSHVPLWFVDGGLSANAVSLLNELDAVEDRGLLTRDYDARHLRQLIDEAQRTRTPEQLSCADIALTVTAARLASDLQRGRIAPSRVGYDLDLHGTPFDAGQSILTLAQSADVRAALDALEPPLHHYVLLKRSLAAFRALARQGELTLLAPLPRTKVEAGASYAGSASLRRLLLALGDLASSQALHPNNVFDESLAAALRRFQKRMGLEADGILGRATYRALTTPLDQRVQQIQLSMERVRWLPRTLTAPPIIVNVPQFRLFAFRTSRDVAQEILQMDVIVGARFDGRETPVFAADMGYLVLNPYWDVPFSIMTHEFLQEIQTDPDWVEKNGYQIVQGPGDDARPVPVSEENIRSLAAGHLRLRQLPGPGNALGRVKFMFPNRHNVYLHDTPTRALFNQSRRALSHGCIRVSDPMALLRHVLREDPLWTEERIAKALEGPPALRIPLPRAIPVFILYGTALATESGDTLFFDDLYSQDARLARLLAARR